MTAPTFKDLGSLAQNLIFNGFPGQFGFNILALASGLSFTSSASQLANKNICTSLLTSKIFKQQGFTVEGSVSSDGIIPTYTGQLVLQDKLFPGLKTILSGNIITSSDNLKKTCSGKVSTLYYYGNQASVEAVFSYLDKPTLCLNLVASEKDTSIGVSSVISTLSETQKLKEYSVKLQQIPAKNFVMNFFWNSQEQVSTGSSLYYNNKDAKLETAASVSLFPFKPGTPPTFYVAIAKTLDNNASLKARFCSENKTISLALKHRICDELSATLGWQGSLSDDIFTNQKFGLALNFII
ncbi:uncharacterized protein LOC126311239 [Schistocerca gregaria]|uniref:uncharacterized protein LOC126311239 n=1 Tax=Schistocerca gregaria TaxID=7010 RepID=UPI00211EF94E|nr:uncharacterized protein LOC126311239 [Schistocerca gregaria]